MARNNRHNTAFVVGAIIGGLAGAAAALWKTPYTGEELRTKVGLGETQTLAGDTMRITPDGEMQTLTTSSADSTTAEGRSFKDKVLSTVENTLAPIVGVELGKTANDGGSVPATTYSTTTSTHTDTASMGPGAGQRPVASTEAPYVASRDFSGEPPAAPSDDDDVRRDAGQVAQESVTPVDRDGGAPSDLSPATSTTGASEEDAASIEQLTKPQTDRVPDALQATEEGEMKPFPDLGGLENERR